MNSLFHYTTFYKELYKKINVVGVHRNIMFRWRRYHQYINPYNWCDWSSSSLRSRHFGSLVGSANRLKSHLAFYTKRHQQTVFAIWQKRKDIHNGQKSHCASHRRVHKKEHRKKASPTHNGHHLANHQVDNTETQIHFVVRKPVM